MKGIVTTYTSGFLLTSLFFFFILTVLEPMQLLSKYKTLNLIFSCLESSLHRDCFYFFFLVCKNTVARVWKILSLVG